MNLTIFVIVLVIIEIIIVTNLKFTDRPVWIYKKLSIDDLDVIKHRIEQMDGRGFEIFCYSLFKMLNYNVQLTQASSDGGKDLILTDNKGEKTYVECKRWGKEDKITRPVAQKLMGAMIGDNVRNGIIMATSEATNECKEYCLKTKIRIYDLDSIMKLVKKVGTTKVLRELGYDRKYWDAEYKEKSEEGLSIGRG